MYALSSKLGVAYCHINSQQQMCDLHNMKITIRWFAYAINISETSVLDISFSKLRDLEAALLLFPTTKKQRSHNVL